MRNEYTMSECDMSECKTNTQFTQHNECGERAKHKLNFLFNLILSFLIKSISVFQKAGASISLSLFLSLVYIDMLFVAKPLSAFPKRMLVSAIVPIPHPEGSADV
jgi:hypothetical protein